MNEYLTEGLRLMVSRRVDEAMAEGQRLGLERAARLIESGDRPAGVPDEAAIRALTPSDDLVCVSRARLEDAVRILNISRDQSANSAGNTRSATAMLDALLGGARAVKMKTPGQEGNRRPRVQAIS